MNQLYVGIIGLGFIGQRHLDALFRLNNVQVVAIMDNDINLIKNISQKYNIKNYYTNLDDMLIENSLNVIHNCTPNFLHFEINKKIIEHGIHCFCEKPLSISSNESRQLIELLNKNKVVMNGVNFNYRMYTMVVQAREMIENNEIGKPLIAYGSFLQDWMLFDTDYNWRVDPDIGGASRAVADIGSHWMDTLQFITKSKIISVCADLVTCIPTRKKSCDISETFKNSSNDNYQVINVKTEDYGAILFKTDSGMSGVFHISQISAGRKATFTFEICGTKSSLFWNQEEPNKLWIGNRETPSFLKTRDPGNLHGRSKDINILPAGHPEGWNDALLANIKNFYSNIRNPGGSYSYATFCDGHYTQLLTEAILKSSENKCWVNIS